MFSECLEIDGADSCAVTPNFPMTKTHICRRTWQTKTQGRRGSLKRSRTGFPSGPAVSFMTSASGQAETGHREHMWLWTLGKEYYFSEPSLSPLDSLITHLSRIHSPNTYQGVRDTEMKRPGPFLCRARLLVRRRNTGWCNTGIPRESLRFPGGCERGFQEKVMVKQRCEGCFQYPW